MNFGEFGFLPSHFTLPGNFLKLNFVNSVNLVAWPQAPVGTRRCGSGSGSWSARGPSACAPPCATSPLTCRCLGPSPWCSLHVGAWSSELVWTADVACRHIHTQMNYTHICIHPIRMHACAHSSTHVHTCTHMRAHTHTHAYSPTHICMHTAHGDTQCHTHTHLHAHQNPTKPYLTSLDPTPVTHCPHCINNPGPN